MKIEANVSLKNKEEKPFPKLMVNNYGCIRLVFNNSSSVVLVSVNNEAPFYESNFAIANFKDFEGSITLSND